MPANLENSAVATGLEKVSFHSKFNPVNNKSFYEIQLMRNIGPPK